MHFYQHHIRDYDTATQHLSWDEDMAYTRLLRWYYRKEQPIPADLNEACRQVRATKPQQREAVQAVLREFFDLREDGWHQDTADEAIAAYTAGEPERDAKKKNEETRNARHRAERAALFAALNAAGEHLPYNAPIADVRALVGRIRSLPATLHDAKAATPATAPATAPATPATATQEPRTENHIDLIPPIPPADAGGFDPQSKPTRARKRSQPKAPAVSLKAWLEAEVAGGRKAIPADDAVFAYAAEVGLPREFLHIAWQEFRTRHLGRDKRYSDWRRVFRSAVRGNWLKVWYIEPASGAYHLTTVGIQAQRAAAATRAAA